MIKHIDIFSIYWYYNLAVRECWNWQTGKTKDLVGVCSCGFKSHLPHYGFERESLIYKGSLDFLVENLWLQSGYTFLG